MHRFIVMIALFAAMLCASPVSAERRVALVVGNSTYKHASRLINPRNDAEAIAATLTKLGFKVVKGIDLNRSAFERKVRDFARAIRGAKVALFFYAGHGLQVSNRNYLAPIDAKLDDEADLEFETVRIETILTQMEREKRTNPVFLDACRDNPLAHTLARTMGTRSANIGRGLARLESGVGTLIAFATQPGNVALDGKGRHNPFTSALLSHMTAPGLDVAVLMRRVRESVLKETAGKQVPWSSSSLLGGFMFSGRPDAPKPRPADPIAPGAGNVVIELAYWDAIKNSKSVADYQGYLKKFPNGSFADLAARRIQKFKGTQQAIIVPPRPVTPTPPRPVRPAPPQQQPRALGAGHVSVVDGLTGGEYRIELSKPVGNG